MNKISLPVLFFVLSLQAYLVGCTQETSESTSLNSKKTTVENIPDGLPPLIPYRKGELWGFADKHKNIVIPVQFKSVQTFEGGYASVERLDGLETYINLKGEPISEFKYQWCRTMVHGVGVCGLPGSRYFGAINRSGQEILPSRFNGMSANENKTISVGLNGRKGITDLKGNFIASPIYDHLRTTFFSDHYPVLAQKDGKYGYIQQHDKVVIPFEFDFASEFSDGVADVQIGDKKYVINPAGEKVLDVSQYFAVSPFHNGVASVRCPTGGNTRYGWPKTQYGIIGKKGNVVLECTYDIMSAGFTHNLIDAGYEVEGKFVWGLVTSRGEELVSPRYQLTNISQYGVVVVKKQKKYGLLDLKGKVLVPPTYETIDPVGSNLARVRLNGKEGLIDFKGKILAPFKYDAIYEVKHNIAEVGMGAGDNEVEGYIDIFGREFFED